MDLARAIVLAAAMLAAFAAPALAQDAECDLLPPEAREPAVYSGWSESHLCEAGQGPLFHGLPAGVDRVTRFTFTQGHALFFRFATLTEYPDGTGMLETGGAGYSDNDARKRWVRQETRHIALTREQVAQFNALADDSGTFANPVGTWDMMDGEEIYLHCQLLEMERADAEGYRFSSVNIGCNQPRRLMPMVEEVMALAGLEYAAEGRLIR